MRLSFRAPSKDDTTSSPGGVQYRYGTCGVLSYYGVRSTQTVLFSLSISIVIVLYSLIYFIRSIGPILVTHTHTRTHTHKLTNLTPPEIPSFEPHRYSWSFGVNTRGSATGPTVVASLHSPPVLLPLCRPTTVCSLFSFHFLVLSRPRVSDLCLWNLFYLYFCLRS